MHRDPNPGHCILHQTDPKTAKSCGSDGDPAFGVPFSSSPGGRFRLRGKLWLLIGLIALGGLAVAVALVPRQTATPVDHAEPGALQDDLGALSAVLAARRPVEPRLSGFAYAPCTRPAATADDLIPLAHCSDLPAPGTDAFRELVDAGTALRSLRDGAATAPLLRTRGLWYLLWVDQDQAVERAVQNLESAAALSDAESDGEGEEAARILSDLAAAYLVRAAKDERPLDLVLALDASGRALEASPDLPEALFNHALAIEALQLRNEARTAWEDVLDAEPTGPWAGEAREHLDVLAQPTLLEAWKAERPLLERAAREGDDEEVAHLVTTYATPVRDWIEEELLPAWGAAEMDGEAEQAADLLAVARAAGDALARDLGEHLPADAVAAIYGAAGPHHQALADGHRAFGQGMKRYRQHDCTAATEHFREAETRFDAAGSPFAARAVLQETICSYYRSPGQSIQVLEGLRHRLPSGRYPTLEGRIAWMIGLCQSGLGDLVAALASYRAGIEIFQQADDPDAGTLSGYAAVVEEALGHPRAAWSGRLKALSILAVQADPRRLYNALHAIVGSLLAEERPDLAVHFQNELLVQAKAWNEPGPLADAFLTRSRIRLALGDGDGALTDVDEAESHAAAVPAGEVRNRLEADLTAGRGRALVQTDPGRAVAALSRAIERYRSIHHVVGVPRLQVSRARASLALDDVDGAEEDLSAAIAEDERRWRDPKGDPDDRLGLREEAQGAYDTMITLRLDRRDDPLSALAWSDRARGRLLRPEDASEDELPTDRSALLRRVPAGVTAVEYAVLPDRVVLWVLGRDVTKVVRPLSQAALSHRIDSLRDLIEVVAPEQQIRKRAGSLFEDLLRPVVDHAGPGDTLVIVPDRALHRLPFAALWDARTSSYLVEHHAIAEAPSLAAVLRGPSGRPRAETPSTLLAVGASKFDGDRFPELPSLPGAEEEAEKIAALYPRSEVLLGDAATPDAFEDLAPSASVLHFAGHALVDPRHPARSLLLLAPPPGGADPGTVTAGALRKLDLGGVDLVYLSACRTVSALPIGSREGSGGLARAALLAGASAVVASRWEADDTSALAMATAFHRRYVQTAAPIAALQAAQRSLLADDRSALHHPASWSGFSIQIGNGSLLSPTTPSTH